MGNAASLVDLDGCKEAFFRCFCSARPGVFCRPDDAPSYVAFQPDIWVFVPLRRVRITAWALASAQLSGDAQLLVLDRWLSVVCLGDFVGGTRVEGTDYDISIGSEEHKHV